jgi:lysophospholipid acyltransferase (LPLAT)-like uncharacterized protein
MERGQRFSFRDRIFFRLASLLGATIIRGLSLSWRREVVFLAERSELPLGYRDRAIYVTWHRRMFAFFDFFGRRHVGVLISLSRDGEIVTQAAEHLGFQPVRGSSTRGAVGGMRELLRRLRSGQPVGFLADGPRGPLRRAKMGAVAASRDQGAPIVPVACSASRAWILRSWDRYIVPKPFARVFLLLGRPFTVPGDADAEGMEMYRRRLEREIDRLCDRADDLAKGPCRLPS